MICRRIVAALAVFALICLSTGCTPVETNNAANTQEKIDRDMYIFWGLLGSYPAEMELNPYHLTRDDKTVNSGLLLYAIRRSYKTPETIAGETGIPLPDVTRKLGELLPCELVTEKNGAYMVNFPYWDEPLRSSIVELGHKVAEKTVAKVRENLPVIRELYEQSSLPSQGYGWDDVSLTLIGGLLLDTGLNDRGLRRWEIFESTRHRPERPGGYRYWYRAVQGGWGDFWKFGHNMSFDKENDAGYGHFFGALRGHTKINWDLVFDVNSPEKRQVMFAIIKHRGLSAADLRRRTGLEEAVLQPMLDEMKRCQVIRMEDGAIQPNFPVFTQHDVDIMLVEIDRICNEIIEQVYVPFIPEIQEAWAQIKPEQWQIPHVDDFFLREVFDRPYNFSLDILIREGTLPESPVEPPFNFWGLDGKFEVL